MSNFSPCPLCGCDDLGARNDSDVTAYVDTRPEVTPRNGFPVHPSQTAVFQHAMHPGPPGIWAVTDGGSPAVLTFGPACEHGIGAGDER